MAITKYLKREGARGVVLPETRQALAWRAKFKLPVAQTGFTLIELLTVIAVIGLLAAIVLVALNEARAKGRDAERAKTLKEVQKAIELYYSDTGFYPALPNAAADARSNGTGYTCADGSIGDQNWCALIAAIDPYYKGKLDDPKAVAPYSYYYDADGSEPQYYGLMVMFETSGYQSVADNDGGQYCSTCSGSKGYKGFELGNEPSYCESTNPGSNWRTGGAGVQCGP